MPTPRVVNALSGILIIRADWREPIRGQEVAVVVLNSNIRPLHILYKLLLRCYIKYYQNRFWQWTSWFLSKRNKKYLRYSVHDVHGWRLIKHTPSLKNNGFGEYVSVVAKPEWTYWIILLTQHLNMTFTWQSIPRCWAHHPRCHPWFGASCDEPLVKWIRARFLDDLVISMAFIILDYRWFCMILS